MYYASPKRLHRKQDELDENDKDHEVVIVDETLTNSATENDFLDYEDGVVNLLDEEIDSERRPIQLVQLEEDDDDDDATDRILSNEITDYDNVEPTYDEDALKMQRRPPQESRERLGQQKSKRNNGATLDSLRDSSTKRGEESTTNAKGNLIIC